MDVSNPNKEVLNFLKPFIEKYDGVVVSDEKYKKNVPKPAFIIYPAIDPLSRKNQKFSEKRLAGCLEKDFGLDLSKPIISQISRFDKWKDPEGVIKVFEKVKKKVPCQLVLLGNMARDDPEGVKVYDNIMKKYSNKKDIHIFCNVADNDFVVNALQTKSAVVIQKSIREGFGLVVAEALYKGTPVVASKVGGIPLQISHGKNGFLHKPHDYTGFANSIIKILKDKGLREEMGKNAKESIIKKFLITSLMLDWLKIFEKYLK